MYVPMREYQRYFKVSKSQLRIWADTDKIDTVRTPGGTRLYKLPAKVQVPAEQANIVYARVYSQKQRADLERQRAFLLERFPNHEVVTDVGSGINWKRPGLLSILDRAQRGAVKQVVVASRDRLCRFAFELLEHVLKTCGTELVVLQSDDQSPEQELSDDLMSIVQVFCCRWNGKRRYSKKAAADEKDQAEPNDVAEASAATLQFALPVHV